MSYWIVVGSAENFQIAIDRGFDLFGFKSTRRGMAGKMQPGDRLIFYLTGIMKFGGIASVTSESFEDHAPIFKSKKPSEDYPFRVQTKAEIVLDEEDWLDVQEWAPRLEYTKKWPPEHWRLAFQGNLRQIPEADYKLIEKEMRALAKKKAKATA
ncbi:MAG: EVE domain-containing protein [Chloroflexi bacterium]|nr:EVE domain-containing protein [Chloroflexota bacterium]